MKWVNGLAKQETNVPVLLEPVPVFMFSRIKVRQEESFEYRFKIHILCVWIEMRCMRRTKIN